MTEHARLWVKTWNAYTHPRTMSIWDREARRQKQMTSAQGGAKTQTEELSHRAHVVCEWTLAPVHDAKVTQQYLIRDFLLKETSGGTPLSLAP